MSEWLRGQWRSAQYTTSLSGFWQTPYLGALDPEIPNLPISLGPEPAIPERIQFVGAIVGSNDGGSISLNLTALTGGIGTTALADDIVVLIHGAGSQLDSNVGAVTSGYSELADLYANDVWDANLSVSWKRMGSTPDTTVQTTTLTLAPHVAIARVYRNVDTVTAIDVTHTTATNTNTGIAVPPGIAPATIGAWVISATAQISAAATALNVPQPLQHARQGVRTFTGDPLANIHVTGGDIPWGGSPVTVTPPSWTGHTDSLDNSWAAITLALRPKPSAAAGISLTADAGAFTFSGVAADLELGREINATSGVFTFTGTAADLELGREVVADPGAFAFTGVAADLEHGRLVTADAGSFAFTGVDADLVLAVDKTITADPGAFTFTGQAADLEYGRLVVADTGTFVFNGQTADLELGREVVADQGTFLFTGQAADLELGREVVADPGNFAFTGVAADLELGREVVADPGSFAFTGTDATLSLLADKILVADPGSFSFTGTAADLERGRIVAALFGTFTFTGTPADLELGREIVAVGGAFTFSGTPADLELGREVTAAPGSFAFTGVAADLEHGREIAAAPGSFGYTGTDADLIYTPSFARPPYSQGFILS